jgi:hypothetical protein
LACTTIRLAQKGKAAKVPPGGFGAEADSSTYFEFVFAGFFGAGAASDFCFLIV